MHFPAANFTPMLLNAGNQVTFTGNFMVDITRSNDSVATAQGTRTAHEKFTSERLDTMARLVREKPLTRITSSPYTVGLDGDGMGASHFVKFGIRKSGLFGPAHDCLLAATTSFVFNPTEDERGALKYVFGTPRKSIAYADLVYFDEPVWPRPVYEPGYADVKKLRASLIVLRLQGSDYVPPGAVSVISETNAVLADFFAVTPTSGPRGPPSSWGISGRKYSDDPHRMIEEGAAEVAWRPEDYRRCLDELGDNSKEEVLRLLRTMDRAMLPEVKAKWSTGAFEISSA